MEKDIKKRNILFGIFICIFLALSAAVVYILLENKVAYPDEPITQESLSTTDEEISISTMSTVPSGDYLIWGVSNIVKIDEIETDVKKMNSSFKLDSSEDGVYYKWVDGDDYVMYELDQNTLIFSISDGLDYGGNNVSAQTFSDFFNTYFGKDWNFEYITKEARGDGEIAYFAQRYLDDENIVEMRDQYQQTDMLSIKDGKIISGKILLTDFDKTKIKIPLISLEDLVTYINVNGYPKEIYPQYAVLQNTLLSEVSYLSDDFQTAVDTLNSCSGSDASVVYLYKSFDQTILVPVFKLDLQCQITYNDKTYTIPAYGYVNAIDPGYINE